MMSESQIHMDPKSHDLVASLRPLSDRSETPDGDGFNEGGVVSGFGQVAHRHIKVGDAARAVAVSQRIFQNCQVTSQTIVEMKFQRMKVSGVLTSPFEAGK